MHKLDDTFMAAMICQHTKLTGPCLSALKALDSKFVCKFFFVMLNTSAAVKLPNACLSKPVVRKLVAKRVAVVAGAFSNLNKAQCITNGKVNWGNAGFFKLQLVEGTNTVSHVMFRFNPEIKTEDISAEGITSDFSLEKGWNIRMAELIKGSRRHGVFDLVTEEKRKFLVGWQGSEKEVNTMVEQIVVELAVQAGTPEIEVSKAQLNEATSKKRTDAMQAARAKLASTKSETVKKRRVNIAEAVSTAA